MTWLDWGILVCILVFAVHGFLRGTVAQVFGVLGLLSGLWVAGMVWSWLGLHWRGAQPFLVFLALRWLVAALGGLAVATVFHWWGERLGEAVRSGFGGWLDRGSGALLGAGLGLAAAALLLMTTLVFEPTRSIGNSMARARTSVPLLHGAADACSLGTRVVPGARWLRARFLKAEQLARSVRMEGRS